MGIDKKNAIGDTVLGWKCEYSRWMKAAANDPLLMSDMKKLEDDKSREDSFYTELEFGTAGLRGIIGAGTNRMNRYVVRRASAGLAKYLLQLDGAAERGVAIAYDSRNYSDVFAMEAALTLCAYGVKCYIYNSLRSVPQLSFTVRRLDCASGIVITASHNPPMYNGYKVYQADGGQCTPSQAGNILDCIRSFDYFDVEPMSYAMALSSEMLTIIGGDIDEEYYRATQTLLLHPDCVKRHGGEISVVYTPLHGSGYVPVTQMLMRIGVSDVSVVAEQQNPDGDFPTVKAPNPEDPNAFTLAIGLANRIGAELCLATDPDSDRLGVAIRRPDNSFMLLTGNQTGVLLCHYILSSMADENKLPSNGLVVKSFVSSAMADAICRKYGISIKDVPTGFRFISEWIERCATSGEYTFIFGFEESYGCLAGGFARDKDAICASALVCEAAVWYKTHGKTLYDVLQEMYRTYGFYLEKVQSRSLAGKEGMERIAGAMAKLRAEPPAAIGGEPVLAYEDFLSDCRVEHDGSVRETGLPKSNALRFILPDGAWVVVRPSGTEPKLKLYVGAVGATKDASEAQLDSIVSYMDALLDTIM